MTKKVKIAAQVYTMGKEHFKLNLNKEFRQNKYTN